MIYTKRIKSIGEKCIVPFHLLGCEIVNVLSWHAKDTKYYTLSPYYLKTDGNEIIGNPGGILFECFYQFSKIYEKVYPIEVYCHPSRKGNLNYLWWKWDSEQTHLEYENNDIIINDDYYTWRNSGWSCTKPIRYPVGMERRKECKGILLDDYTLLSYLDSRKQVYISEYIRLVKQTREYKFLLSTLESGKDICIFEIDVPSKGKRGNYGKLADENGIFECNLEHLDNLENDVSEAFGHGLCLAKSLLEDLKK